LSQPAPSRIPFTGSAYARVFSAELDLILSCCGNDPDGSLAARARLILQQCTDLDWDRLLQLAQHHGLVPLLYRRLATITDAVSPTQLEAFRRQETLNAHRTLWLSGELLNIYRHLLARGLESLPYKGPVLAETLYGNVALRQFSDLDFLVRSRDLPAIRSALAEMGYQAGLQLTKAAERAYVKSGYEYTFDSPQGQNLVEIKWQVLPRFYSINFEVNDFFERAVIRNLAGQRLRTLCDQDLMLVLCVHAAKHSWMQISWLCDIAQLARSRVIDWEALRLQAEKLGIRRIVSVSFLLAQQLLAAPLPVQFNADDDPAAKALAERVSKLTVGEADFDPESVSYFRLMMDLRERRRDRMSFLWRLCTTPGPGEWSVIRLPGLLFPLYRVVRMFRHANRMVASLSKT
jgi:Uncharacterised nucleotidyltransferase